MEKLVIFGLGDVAQLAHYYFTRDTKHEVVAFTVDRDFRKLDRFCGLPVVDFESVSKTFPPGEFKMFIAIGYGKMNKSRAGKYNQSKNLGYALESYVSSRATILTAEIGDNCFILEDNTVQPFVKIGNNVTLWSGNHIGHHSTVDDHCFISSQVVISGHVHVKPYCFLGVNSTIINDITLEAETLVGAGAIIMKDTPEKSVYIPQRAELFKKKSDEVDL